VLSDGELVACDSPEGVAASDDRRVRVLVDTLVRPPERSVHQ
jgi:hypothetical protein